MNRIYTSCHADIIIKNEIGSIRVFILTGNVQAATAIFTNVVNNEKADIDTILKMIDTLVFLCKTWKETETITIFKEHLLPILKTKDHPKYTEYVVKLEEEIDVYCRSFQQQV